MTSKKRDDIKKESGSLADRWLEWIKNTRIVAVIVVAGTIVIAVAEFWDKVSNLYETRLETPISLDAFYLADTSTPYFDEVHRACAVKSENRGFKSAWYVHGNHAASLDFVFSNKSAASAVFTEVDVVVTAAEEVAGGEPGIVIPNHVYIVNLKHEVGTQSFTLTPAYKIPPKDTGSFTVVFNPATEGVGLCWILYVVFKTNQGSVRSEPFSLVMSNFRRN